jgi:hypothetical protein
MVGVKPWEFQIHMVYECDTTQLQQPDRRKEGDLADVRLSASLLELISGCASDGQKRS